MRLAWNGLQQLVDFPQSNANRFMASESVEIRKCQPGRPRQVPATV
jgi:hypothetical protein